MAVLPINLNPLLKTYQNTALPLAAVSCGDHEEKVINFCINQFIQLKYNRNKGTLDFWHDRHSEWSCIEVKNKLRNDYIDIWNLSLLDIMKSAIDSGLYVYIVVDEFYIPARRRYQKEYYPHDILVFGYNENEIITLGYNEQMVLSTAAIANSVFLNAVKSVRNKFFIDFFDYASYNVYPIKIKQIKTYLNDYIQSVNSDTKHKFINTGSICSYGIDSVYDMLNNEKARFECNGILDFRNFDCYYEHKRLMNLRIHKMAEIIGNNKYNIDYEDIKNDAFIIRNLALKANISKKSKILEDIQFKLEENVKQEIDLLSNILLEIS